MRACPAATGIVLLLLLHAAAGTCGDIWVSMSSPREGDVAFGDVDVVAEVVAAAGIREVAFLVDGRLVGTLMGPPWRLRLSLGEGGHRIEVVARDVAGGEARDSVETLPVASGAELEVELNQLYVTVDSDRGRLGDLKRSDFLVFDDGERQQLVSFERGDIPFTAILLLDASASMRGEKLDAATTAAAAFVDGMQPLDLVRVMAFSDRLLQVTPLADDKQLLRLALTSLEGRGGTALYDHLYVAVKQLDRHQGRRVVIFLSDGVDSHSILTMDDVGEAVRRSQALLYWIRLGRAGSELAPDRPGIGLSSAWRGQEEYRRQLKLLERTVASSGGRTVRVAGPGQLEAELVGILRELREQYVLGYYPTTRRNDGTWHKVRVEVRRIGAEVRAHDGYVDY